MLVKINISYRSVRRAVTGQNYLYAPGFSGTQFHLRALSGLQQNKIKKKQRPGKNKVNA